MSDTISAVEFTDEDGTVIKMEVLAQTKLNDTGYLLVKDPDDDIAYIMKEVTDDDESLTYVMVEDDTEIEAVGDVFAELMEDYDLES